MINDSVYKKCKNNCFSLYIVKCRTFTIAKPDFILQISISSPCHDKTDGWSNQFYLTFVVKFQTYTF